jgi:hypothetical protein
MESNSNSQLNLGQLSNTISSVGKAFVVSKVWKVVGLVIVALGVGGYFLVKSIKKTALSQIPLPDLPNGTVTDPSKGIDTNEQFKIIARQYADELFSVTNDWFVLAYQKEVVFKKLWALNDTQLVYVHRVFSTLYYSKNNETMTQAINNETNYILEIGGGIKARLVTRLNSLGAN